MITQRQVIRVLREFHKGVGDTTLRRYIYILLNALSNEELQILIYSDEVPPGVRIRAMQILEKRMRTTPLGK